MTKHMNIENNLVEKLEKKQKILEKTRGNCEAEACPPPKKNKIPKTLLEVFGT